MDLFSDPAKRGSEKVTLQRGASTGNFTTTNECNLALKAMASPVLQQQEQSIQPNFTSIIPLKWEDMDQKRNSEIETAQYESARLNTKDSGLGRDFTSRSKKYSENESFPVPIFEEQEESLHEEDTECIANLGLWTAMQRLRKGDRSCPWWRYSFQDSSPVEEFALTPTNSNHKRCWVIELNHYCKVMLLDRNILRRTVS